jgi:hypothetical protein
MTGLRALLTVLIAISVAVLPATAEVVVLASPDQVTVAYQAEMPCCSCCDNQGDFKATACALQCAALAGAVLPAMPVTLLFLAEGSPLALAERTLHGLVRAPPTHPPPARPFRRRGP